jgi:hypothetical protein
MEQYSTTFEIIRTVIDRADRAMRERNIYASITIELDQKDWDEFRHTLPPMVTPFIAIRGITPPPDDFVAVTVGGHTVRLKQ